MRIIVLLLTLRLDSAFSRNKSCMPDFVDCFLGEAFDKMNVHRPVTLVCDPFTVNVFVDARVEFFSSLNIVDVAVFHAQKSLGHFI